MQNSKIKNIIFDLGGVLFRRDPKKCTPDFIDFFAFVRFPKMPLFWEEYDRGTYSLDEVIDLLCREKGVSREQCVEYVRLAIDKQEEIAPTEALIRDLKGAGYRLYVLSNMSREFIDFLRTRPVYRSFDGEVISCEEHVVKPEPRIYQILKERYELQGEECLFIDDRHENIEAAEREGIGGFWFDRDHPEKACAELRERLLGQ